ncbi:MAG: bifunctional 4-hydroxy-3-methylbut-2-enyl diphosphate reductase/30S ribosomal protein S1 [Defluviitaleaceae bacterium]|nr:bifunctional 4-hydroxy-3-methylbut-2-enyl diphosphate reductase/30S ribosomal protein S1 [Defluviitaleaceae bacterium]
MEILLAKTAGFCIGVKMAVDKVYNKINDVKMATYGPIIHNKHVTEDLKNKGVDIIDSFENVTDETVVIRTHGVPPKIYNFMDKNSINYVDYTCPFVKKIHKIGGKEKIKGNKIIIVGDKEHPEIIGIDGFCGNESIIIKTLDEALSLTLDPDFSYSVVVQTTFQNHVFEEIVNVLKLKSDNISIHNTICNATLERQAEANELSKKVDKMIVLGDRLSANSNKLYKICKENCKDTYFVESINEIKLNIFQTSDKIGITAGASTPLAVIKEAISTMSEIDKNDIDKKNQTFEEMLEDSFVELHTGDVVKGTILRITHNEISVNLNYKSDGVITKEELSENPNIDLKSMYNIGDEIEVAVLKVNDGDGNVMLSRKRIEEQKNKAILEEAYKNNTPIKGKVVDVVKGGIIALINDTRVFVPSSQMSSRFVEDLSQFKGKEMLFNIIEYNKERNRVVAGRKEIVLKEEAEKKAQMIESLEAGMDLDGKISRVVDFGIFINLGVVDGLVHISEISWNKSKKSLPAYKVGDIVKVRILKLDKEKQKISLSIKELLPNPWDDVETKYEKNSIVKGKVVRTAKFGAFIELEENIDGLIHISHLSMRRIEKPEEVLKVGDVIDVKILEIDKENKKISLSKKEADQELGIVEESLNINNSKVEPEISEKIENEVKTEK